MPRQAKHEEGMRANERAAVYVDGAWVDLRELKQ
jgi:hypothetical protein